MSRHTDVLAYVAGHGITRQDFLWETKMASALIRTDLYINAGFQMTLNTLRRVGIRPTWLMLMVHVGVLYYFLTFAVVCALADDVFGLVLGCLVATYFILLLMRGFYEFFLIVVGDGATVDAMRLKFQQDMLDQGTLWIVRPGCLVGALMLFAVDPGLHPPMEPFTYGFLLMSLGFYIETCV
jgi:hypothetical protein